MVRSMRYLLAVAILCLSASALPAQSGYVFSLEPGERIRLNGPELGDKLVTARVVSWNDALLRFTIEGSDIIHTRQRVDLASLDAQRHSRRGGARSGLLWGGYLGASTGIIAGALLAGNLDLQMEHSIAIFAAGGGAFGLATGAALGAILVPDRWYRFVFTPGGS
jgi:hypothetical protein